MSESTGSPEVRDPPHPAEAIEMPRSTIAPVVLAAGLLLAASGVAFSLAMSIVGVGIAIVGLCLWIAEMLPGSGHTHEERAAHRPQPITPVTGAVQQLHAGMPGYRMRLPLEVHPIFAGVKGGLAGGLLMPVPALIWGYLSGHGIWYPINLLAGVVLNSVGNMPEADLERFRPSLFLVGCVIHGVMSVVFGLLYGVLLPTLPQRAGTQLAWAGLVLPLLWTGASYGLMGVVNPRLQQDVDWPWFIGSQIVYGVVTALVVMRTEKIAVPPAGSGLPG